MAYKPILCCLAAVCCLAAYSEEADTAIWSVDPLIKVFQDAVPESGTVAEAHVARGEKASFQLVLRAVQDIAEASVSVSAFTPTQGGAGISPAVVRFVGYVNVDRPTQKPSLDQLRKPPADYPDILRDAAAGPLTANTAQPVWITVPVPLDTAPGEYLAKATVALGTDAGEFPLKLVVYPVTVEKTRLWVTNWFSMHWPHMSIAPEPESEEYYALLRRYARNMAEHRQNVALISPLSLTQFGVDASGTLTFNFERFDRWVRIFQEEGVIGRIEGGHLGGRTKGWLSDFAVSIQRVVDGKVVGERVAPDSEEARTFYASFLPALTAHLRENGWLEIYMQHLADEPIPTNQDTYRVIAALIREYAPDLKIMEANHAKELVGAMDIWVPQLNFLHEDYDFYRERQAAGDEIWFYTCVFPQGEYANRFIEQPLIKTRLLHWINYVYNATGYLHWGYNHWSKDDPATNTTRPHSGPPYLPAGDPWIVYPGKDGPLDSIRAEAMCDGIVDHELLCRLAEVNPEEARSLATRHIHDFDKYDTDVERFRETRRLLLNALSHSATP